MSNREPEIIIDGVRLTEAQAMAIRCAIEHFDSDLATNGLGEDAMGRSICQGYRERLREIRRIQSGELIEWLK